MTSPLEVLEPKSLWREFDALRKIPRPSKKEERARAHVRAIFSERGYEILQDSTGNVVVKVPATKGHEKAPTVVIQSHLDMVTEKNADTKFDWDKDPINVYVDGDWVKAKGTTLGADNGIGVAAAIASALDPDVVHGPLELLFTVDEETGLTGAMGLDGSILEGRSLLNLDTEDDGVLCVGCAGGCNSNISWTGQLSVPSPGTSAARVHVTGLSGGHSGCDIHLNRGNAIKVLLRLLARAAGGAEQAGGKVGADLRFELATISGGDKHNAIPREAEAVVVVPTAALATLRALAKSEQQRALVEFATSDPELTIEIEEVEMPSRVFAAGDRNRLMALLSALPNGVLAMSRDIAGLVETSNNLARVRTKEARVEILTSARSSVAPALRATLDQIDAIAALADARAEEQDGYPGWQPDMDSALLATCQKVYRDLYDKDPVVEAVHAGLETALIGKKVDGMDMISYGPDIKGPHSPDERVKISSVARFWDYHKALLEALA